jgi:hypothetical protein
MRISKGGCTIESVEAWFACAPPKRGRAQWKDGRSAKELAKAWFSVGSGVSIPEEFLCLLNSSRTLGSVSLCEAWPEVAVRFDPFRGEPRNCDLLVRGISDRGPVMVSVEAKADERFGDLVGASFDAAAKRHKSNAPERMRRLAKAVLGKEVEEIRSLRYQLLYATAATLSAAEKHGAQTAIFIVHEFVTALTEEAKHRQNNLDFQNFVSVLSAGEIEHIQQGHLLGPLRVPGNDNVSGKLDLYIGKAVRNTVASPSPPGDMAA